MPDTPPDAIDWVAVYDAAKEFTGHAMALAIQNAVQAYHRQVSHSRPAPARPRCLVHGDEWCTCGPPNQRAAAPLPALAGTLAAALPTDPEDERIVDAAVRRATGEREVRPLKRAEPPPAVQAPLASAVIHWREWRLSQPASMHARERQLLEAAEELGDEDTYAECDGCERHEPPRPEPAAGELRDEISRRLYERERADKAERECVALRARVAELEQRSEANWNAYTGAEARLKASQNRECVIQDHREREYARAEAAEQRAEAAERTSADLEKQANKIIGQLHAEQARTTHLEKLLAGIPGAVVSWCPQCGPEPRCDEDGCCAQCGATVGEVPDWRGLQRERDEARAQLELWRPVVEAAYATPLNPLSPLTLAVNALRAAQGNKP